MKHENVCQRDEKTSLKKTGDEGRGRKRYEKAVMRLRSVGGVRRRGGRARRGKEGRAEDGKRKKDDGAVFEEGRGEVRDNGMRQTSELG